MRRFPALAIIYYGLTIIMGIVLAFYFLMYGETSKIASTLTDRVDDSDWLGVTKLLSVYQNPDAVLEEELSDGTTVYVYEVDTTYTYTDDDDNSYYLLEKGYMGIVSNLSDNWDRDDYTNSDGDDENQFGLEFIGLDSDGNTVNYEYRIGFVDDEDDLTDDELETIENRYYSYTTCGFYYFLIGDQVFEDEGFASVSTLEFVNSDSTVYEDDTIDLGTWTLDSDFYTLVDSFNTEYNEMVLDDSDSDDIDDYASDFNTTIEEAGFVVSDYSTVVKYVYVIDIIKILAYFGIVVWAVGDILVGKHHLIHLVARIFGKNSAKTSELPDYMQEYEVNVTCSAKVPDNYSKTITIKYVSETNNEVSFVLTKSNHYTVEQKLKNGMYSHPTIASDSLKCLDVPSTLNIKGLVYKVKFDFKLK